MPATAATHMVRMRGTNGGRSDAAVFSVKYICRRELLCCRVVKDSTCCCCRLGGGKYCTHLHESCELIFAITLCSKTLDDLNSEGKHSR